jgi:hypothetical protein
MIKLTAIAADIRQSYIWLIMFVLLGHAVPGQKS